MANLVKYSVNVDDKVFLVTGGAAGVGAGVVRALVAGNARHVAFLDLTPREGAALELELTQTFGALKAKFIKCDVSNEEQLFAAYQQVLDKYRRLDTVINCAAILSYSGNSCKKMVDINFTATVNSTHKALEVMGEDNGGGGGCVVNISSLLALTIGTHLPVYAATKTAILQFSVSMGKEEYYNKTKVRVLTVCLGPTDTAILLRNNAVPDDTPLPLKSRAIERQSHKPCYRVASAVNGILAVIDHGTSGSTWIVRDDKPAYEFTKEIADAFQTLSIH